MAAPTNTVQTTSTVGIREELLNNIYNVDPDETPLLSALPKTGADNTKTDWQTDGLDAPTADNVNLEGDDTVAGVVTPTVRLDNQTQIFKKSYTISGTMESTNRAGRGSEAAYQALLKAKAIKTDMEMSIFANKAKVTGNTRVLAGIPAWITTNTSAGASGADPTGDGSDARTDGTQRAFTETLLSDVLENIWTNSGVEPDCVYMGGANKKLASGFTGSRSMDIDASKKTLVTTINVYDYDFGTVRFEPNRHVRARDVVIMRNDMWEWRELRPLFEEELAKTGDAKKYQMVAEATLICRNEKANGIVADTGG